ncbi:MAG: phosphoenolpyruvate carboxykinase (GTP) [Candidatus Obscuribacterales bacterium]
MTERVIPTLPAVDNAALRDFIERTARLCRPQRVHLCDGSQQEFDLMCRLMCEAGTVVPLNPELRPGSFLARSAASDVARVEDRTFICCDSPEDAGPTNKWWESGAARARLLELFDGCMAGRTMYVIPFVMGPLGSPVSRIGVEISDSPYVVASMQIMTRMGAIALSALGQQGTFVPCLHSVGKPLAAGESDVAWPCNPQKYICHFTQTGEIFSFGSGYGGNALLGKKCLALRLASCQSRESGWLAEHMLILGLEAPSGEKRYFAAAFPSACGKTNLAMLIPPAALPGWKLTTLGDDIAWIWVDSRGRFRAVNPEAGFFGVAPQTSAATNPNAIASIARRCIFTNTALTPEGDVWWEGKTPTPPAGLIDWQDREWTPGGGTAAHANSRFTVSASNCPSLDDQFDSPEGVEISGFIFGGRSPSLMPLVVQSFDWSHGVYLGAVLGSQTTAAAEGTVGVMRRDPMAMRPFCGYNMGDYFAHWLRIGTTARQRMAAAGDAPRLPPIFAVNWFRKDPQGNFLWPGYSENLRVLQWMFSRCRGDAQACNRTPLGFMPRHEDLDWRGLSLTPWAFERLTSLASDLWRTEFEDQMQFLEQFGSHLPAALMQQWQAARQRFLCGT